MKIKMFVAALVFLAFLGHGPCQFHWLGQIPANLLFDNLAQGHIRHAEIGGIGNQGTVHTTTTGVELAHPTRDQIDQYVGVANLFQSFFAEFSVHSFCQSESSKTE